MSISRVNRLMCQFSMDEIRNRESRANNMAIENCHWMTRNIYWRDDIWYFHLSSGYAPKSKWDNKNFLTTLKTACTFTWFEQCVCVFFFLMNWFPCHQRLEKKKQQQQQNLKNWPNTWARNRTESERVFMSPDICTMLFVRLWTRNLEFWIVSFNVLTIIVLIDQQMEVSFIWSFRFYVIPNWY